MYRKRLIRYNYATRMGNRIEYIVVHDTGNSRNGADAAAHCSYFDQPGRNASAHYLVDSREVVQIVEDFHAAWHCGDGRGKYGINNSNSIGIELCINGDGDWNETRRKGIDLIRGLMKKHGLPKERVVGHFDASGKLCPRSMSDWGWREWTRFYDKI